MSYDYNGLRTHLLLSHLNMTANSLGDGEAVQYHHGEHHGPGGLRGHLHHDTLPPSSWSGIPPLPDVNDPYLTIAEIATQLRVSKMTVYRLVHEKAFAAVKIGRSYRVRTSAITNYLGENTNA